MSIRIWPSLVPRCWNAVAFRPRLKYSCLEPACQACPRSGQVLLIRNMLHPVDLLAVQLLLNGDMGNGRGWRGAVPVLFARWDPDYVAGPDFLDGAAPSLGSAAPGGH